MIRYGTNPVAWSNDDDPTLGADIPLQRCLRQAGAIGFDGIENGHKFPWAPEALRAALAESGLRLISAWCGLDLLQLTVAEQKTNLQPALDRLAAMGCDMVIACETSNAIHADPRAPLSARPVLPRADWPWFGEKLEAIAAFTAAQGLTLVYHPHGGTIVETPEEYDLLMAETGPATRLLFDTGHCWLGGGDPAAVLARHADRLGHLHMKNVRPAVAAQAREADLPFLDAVRRGVFTVPGDPEGTVDFPAVLEVAAAAGYDGWLVIEAEQDATFYDPVQYQSLGLDTLREMARMAGLGNEETGA